MRSIRFCKTILNRLGTYNKENNVWAGKFPMNANHKMYLSPVNDFYGRPTENAIIILETSTKTIYLRYPAQELRRQLWSLTCVSLHVLKLFISDQRITIFSGLTMYDGYPYLALQLQSGNYRRSLPVRSPISLAIFADAWKNVSLWPIFLDSLIDHEQDGERFVKLFKNFQAS